MRKAVPATSVLRVLPSPVSYLTGGGMVGELPLHVRLADEVMAAVLRSAGHTAVTFPQDCRGFAAGLQSDALTAAAAQPYRPVRRCVRFVSPKSWHRSHP